ncbi:MAG TPA: SRPBCC domain-containing protein [Bacteroidia bacterium]|nr:SRPBCC domain-containing protein [Bacteroidia bacterium]
MGTPENKTIIQYKHTFKHPVGKVFRAFLEAASVKLWFGPKEFSIGTVELEPKVGGNLSIEMISPRGDVFWMKGLFTEITEDYKIVYDAVYEPDVPNLGNYRVSYLFKAGGQQTEVTVVQEIYKVINPEGRTKGWEDGFAKLEAILD